MLPKGSIAKIYNYYFNSPRYNDDIMSAFRQFFDQPDLDQGDSIDADQMSDGLFNEWFLYDFKLTNGETVLVDFISRNPLKISIIDISLYRNLLTTNTYSLFEVVTVDIDKGLMLKNLRTKKDVYVHEQKLTRQVQPGDMFFLRVAKVGDNYEIVGADSFLVGDSNNGVIKKLLLKNDVKFTPKLARDIWAMKQN